MMEQIKYINHLGEELSFGKNGLYAQSSDLHDFAYELVSYNNKISNFKKGITSKSLKIIVFANTDDEALAIKNNLYEIPEKDILAMQSGKLYIGDYYLKCYITANKKTEYLKDKKYLTSTLTIQTDAPDWIKETTTTYMDEAHRVGEVGGSLDFNNDFPYDYTSITNSITNYNFSDCDFRLKIYGSATNPEIKISGHTYKVNCTLRATEYLIIDSLNKTILKYDRYGNSENLFNYRDKENYIFEKIKSGGNAISWSETFKFDLTLLERRGEPTWT